MLIVYSKKDCSRCHTLKARLEQKRIPHKTVMLDEHYTREELKQLLPSDNCHRKMFPFVFNSNGFIFMADDKVDEFIDNF